MVRGREARDYRWAGVVLVLLMSVRQGAGQECTTFASTLYACFPYVQVGNSTPVGADCCVPLQSIVETHPDCVCTLQNLTSSVPHVNITRAYGLSTLCNIKSTATLSSCNGTADRNGAFTLHRDSTFHVVLMGLALLVYFLNQA